MIVIWGIPIFWTRRRYSPTFHVDTLVNGPVIQHIVLNSGQPTPADNDNMVEAA